MSSERPDEFSKSAVNRAWQTSKEEQGGQNAARNETTEEATCHQATVLVHGETIRDQDVRDQNQTPQESARKGNDKNNGGPEKEVSEAKLTMQSRLPALDDDADIGVQKEQLVVRDGKADLAFTGTLVASVAPASADQERWEEYRIYETNGGKHVFSKVTRSVFAEEPDRHKAEVFEPSPSSVPSQLLRSARDLTRSRPLAWTDSAVAFFGYDPLAKALYRKLGHQFEEHIG